MPEHVTGAGVALTLIGAIAGDGPLVTLGVALIVCSAALVPRPEE